MRRRWYATAAMALLEGRRAPARTREGMAAFHLRGMTNGTWADPPVTGGQRSGGIGSLVGGELLLALLLILEGLQDRHHDLVHVLVEELAGPEEHCGSDEAERRHDEERGAQVLVEDRRQRADDERRGRHAEDDSDEVEGTEASAAQVGGHGIDRKSTRLNSSP